MSHREGLAKKERKEQKHHLELKVVAGGIGEAVEPHPPEAGCGEAFDERVAECAAVLPAADLGG